MADYIREFAELDVVSEQYKEKKRELKKSYQSQKLTGEDLRVALKIYRFLKKDEDFYSLVSDYEKVVEHIKEKGEL